MCPIPAACALTPVSNDARVGEHIGLTWKLVNRTPSAANRSRLGVSISPPKQPMSEKPTSSTSTNTTLGAPAGVVAGTGQWLSDPAIVRPIVPSKPKYGAVLSEGSGAGTRRI